MRGTAPARSPIDGPPGRTAMRTARATATTDAMRAFLDMGSSWADLGAPSAPVPQRTTCGGRFPFPSGAADLRCSGRRGHRGPGRRELPLRADRDPVLHEAVEPGTDHTTDDRHDL